VRGPASPGGWPGWQTVELSLYAVYPNWKFLAPKVRSFVDFLVERFAATPEWVVDEISN
jgi:DNA-binding transcriptional LysR family regulator